MAQSASGGYGNGGGSYIKNIKQFITEGVDKIMGQYNQIKSNANPDIFGQSADAMKRAMEDALPKTRSGAPAPNRYKPLK